MHHLNQKKQQTKVPKTKPPRKGLKKQQLKPKKPAKPPRKGLSNQQVDLQLQKRILAVIQIPIVDDHQGYDRNKMLLVTRVMVYLKQSKILLK